MANVNEKSLSNLKPFKKGYDKRREGNGRKPVMPDMKESIAMLLNGEDGGRKRIDLLFEKLYDLADDGNVQAIKELLDRGYGKPQQTIEQTNINPEPLQLLVDKETAERLNSIE